MSTRCSIAYEDDFGNCIGVYCHYDGYPSRMYPIIKEATFEDIRTMVEDALQNGGLRYVESDFSYETYGETSARALWLRDSPFANINGVDYTYYKRKDGSVFATSYEGKEIDYRY